MKDIQDISISEGVLNADTDILLIVPPFQPISSPSFGVHILQAFANEVGFKTEILYANLLYSKYIGYEKYEKLSTSALNMIGEKMFYRSAFEKNFFDQKKSKYYPYSYDINEIGNEIIYRLDGNFKGTITQKLIHEELLELEKVTYHWVELVGKYIAGFDYKIAGCTCSFEQINSSLSILKAIKNNNPAITSIIGGANCCGKMAEGIASLDKYHLFLDHIFSGESEITFINFLKGFFSESFNFERIIRSDNTYNLNNSPSLDYSTYLSQLFSIYPNYKKENISLPYETSRGCWWGQKEPCKFCGLNSDIIQYREKAAEKVFLELEKLTLKYPDFHIAITDNVMPYRYFKTLIPLLKHKKRQPRIAFYEQRPKLSLDQINDLKNSGIIRVGAGIETFSPQILQLINKGITFSYAIRFLRYSASVGLMVLWHLLWGIPGEKCSEYKKMISLIPFISHLPPPTLIFHLSITRYSQYYNNPEQNNIKNLRPVNVYNTIFPDTSDIDNLANFFTGEYQSGLHDHPEVAKVFLEEIQSWKKRWLHIEERPILFISKISDKYMLVDTRKIAGKCAMAFINRRQAKAALLPGKYESREVMDWAIENKLAIVSYSDYIPLAMASYELLKDFEIEGWE